MVKKGKIFNKTLLKEIKNTIKYNFKRFLTLVLIIFLGVGFYIGMKVTAPDMKDTLKYFFQRTKLMDLNIVSVIGFTDRELESLKENVPIIQIVEGAYQLDVVSDIKGTSVVLSVSSYNPDKELNKLEIVNGRLPQSKNECVIDELLYNKGYNIGSIVELNTDQIEIKNLTVVGIVRSPLYISNDRGTTSLLSGKIDYFIYIDEKNFITENYSVVYLKYKNDLYPFSDEYKEKSIEIRDLIKEVSRKISQEHKKEEIASLQNNINKMENAYIQNYNNYKKQLEYAEKELANYEQQISDGYSKIKTEEEINDYLSEYKAKLDQVKKQLDSSKKKIDTLKKIYKDSINFTDKNQQEIINLNYQKEKLENEIKISNNNINIKKSMLDFYKNSYEKAVIPSFKQIYLKKIENLEKDIENINKEIEQKNLQIAEIDKQIQMLSNSSGESAIQYPSNIVKMEEEYNESYNQYTIQLKEFENASNNLKAQNEELKNQLNNQKNILNTKKNELEETKQKVTLQLDESKLKIEELKDKIALLENSDWYVFTRNDNPGYSQYSDDVERIDNLSKIFPIIFFIIVVMITLNTISRMVDEERIKIGTLKALGYNDKQILSKYMIYSLIAVFLGSSLGILIGLTVIPSIIYKVYLIMYDLPKLYLGFGLKYIFIAILVSTLSTLIPAYLTCRVVLKEMPYKLMRPKTPKGGKKCILEKFRLIWNKLKFTQKVTWRNLFCYKKRMFMTIIGVAGCTSLIVTGFALRDSISSIVPIQYQEIFSMDAQLFFKDDVERSSIILEEKRISNLDNVKCTALSHLETIEVMSSHKKYNAYLVVPENNNQFFQMILLRNKKTYESYNLSDNGVIVSQKIAELLNLKVGDKIEFKDNYGEHYQVIVENITENYVDHYIYMSSTYYNSIKNISPRNNMLLVKTTNEFNKKEFEKELNANNLLSSITFLSIAKEAYHDIVKNLNSVVLIMIISAVFLALAVLYNLMSINISERKRELATLKVLGFRKKEVQNYVKKETNILTFIGIIIGLFVSYFLSSIIINSCEIDSLKFNDTFNLLNYIYAIIITYIFLIIVNLLTNRELSRLKMNESLKSIE